MHASQATSADNRTHACTTQVSSRFRSPKILVHVATAQSRRHAVLERGELNSRRSQSARKRLCPRLASTQHIVIKIRAVYEAASTFCAMLSVVARPVANCKRVKYSRHLIRHASRAA